MAFAVPPKGVEHDRRPIATAFAISASLHGLIAMLAALAIGGGGLGREAPRPSGLQAVLASPAQEFVSPEPARENIPPPAASAAITPALPRPKSLVPQPIRTAAAAEFRDAGEGRVILQIAEPDALPEPAAIGALHEAHPGAVRVAPEFDVEPSGVYPKAALAAQRQAEVVIVAVVHTDGRLEVAPGTFDDPVFGASIREALAMAKARPPHADGRPVTGWALLRFYYEFVGSGAAPAAALPSR